MPGLTREKQGNNPLATIENAEVLPSGHAPYRTGDAQGAQDGRITSIPLRTALRIARERQRSKSSRRKIFREEPERYLDIVNLMKEVKTE